MPCIAGGGAVVSGTNRPPRQVSYHTGHHHKPGGAFAMTRWTIVAVVASLAVACIVGCQTQQSQGTATGEGR
jgi:hypothetical protein